MFTAAFSYVLQAQEPALENGSLEEWEYNELYDFEEPAGIWTTANRIRQLSDSAPVTTFRETEDVVAGDAVRMITESFSVDGGLPVAGVLAVGEFEPDPLNPVNSLKMGKPFDGRPTYFRGYYKYFPAPPDSADIYCLLSRWTGSEQEIVGSAWLREYGEVSEYTYFNMEIEYLSDATPDSMTVICTSSAGGAEFVAVIGSELYVDELAFSYEDVAVPLIPEVEVSIAPNPATDFVLIRTGELLKEASVDLISMDGKISASTSFRGSDTAELDVSHLSAGSYIYIVKEGERALASGRLTID